MANPITVNLPADLPTNWVEGQTVAPAGSDVGLSEQHGYNYLMQQVNNAQTAANQLGAAFDGLDTKILVVPTQSGSVVYNGQTQSPTWNGYDTRRMTLGGTTSATNAGTYNATFAPKSGFAWSDGTTTTKTVTWTIKKAVIPVLPSQADKLIYNGSAQSPTWLNYDSNKLTLGGTTSRTNAGSSNATFTPASNYTWWDGTTSSKTVSWSISKAGLPTPALSSDSITLNKDNNSAVVTVLRAGDGAITASSSDSSLATVSVSSNVLTITAVKKDGLWDAQISVNVSQGTNYRASESAVIIQISGEYVPVYGVKFQIIGTGNSNLYSMTRTDYAENFADPVPYVAGSSAYGSPFDSIMPWSGLRKVTDSYGNQLVEIPKFYYKISTEGGYITIQISMTRLPGFVTDLANCARSVAGVFMERDYVYIGRYHTSYNDTYARYRSITGMPPFVSKSIQEARTASRLNNGYFQTDFALDFTLWLLYIVEFADWNSQAKIGYGCGNGSSVQNMGYTDSMPYHTGTTLSSRTTYGLGTQYRYIEGLWDNCFDWIEGIYYDADKRMHIQLQPEEFSYCDTGTGGTVLSETQSPSISSGTPTKLSAASFNGFSVFIPIELNSGASGMIPDNWTMVDRTAGIYGYYRGGYYGRDVSWGLFCNSAAYSARPNNVGSRMMYLPVNGGRLS